MRKMMVSSGDGRRVAHYFTLHLLTDKDYATRGKLARELALTAALRHSPVVNT